MFWKVIGLLICLAIGVPIIQNVYNPAFTNSTIGMLNSNVTSSMCTTGVPLTTDAEFALWQLMPIIIVLIILGFLFSMVGGKFRGKQ